MNVTYEIYKLPQGKIIIGSSDKNLSIGLLHLLPQQTLDKHNRPVTEQLVQVSGACVMKLFEGETIVKEVTLNEGDSLVIPANQYHIHSNNTDKPSITLWKFEGDIAEVIKKIKETNVKIL